MFAALALAAMLAAPIQSCDYKANLGITVCKFSVVSTVEADPGEVVIVRGQIRALDVSDAFDSVQKLTAGVGSIGTRGRSTGVKITNAFVAYSEAAGWATYASVRHAEGDDSHFRFAFAYFAGNEEGNVKIRTKAVVKELG